MRTVIRAECDRFPSDSTAAKRLGISRSHLSRVLSGGKPVTARVALALGYELQTWFVPYEERE
jgi:plasmid maintenance system antidote protein VapI